MGSPHSFPTLRSAAVTRSVVGWGALVFCCRADVLQEGFLVSHSIFSPVTIGTNWPCPCNQRNVRLARGSKYISWQQDKSKSTEKFLQREYFLCIQLCLVLRCPYQSNYCMGDADWLEEPVHSGSVMESGRSSASWGGRR